MILVGCLVLVGWVLNINALKSVLPGLETMKANTALAFVLAGLSLWLLWTGQADPPGGTRRYIARVCAAIVSLMGLLTLSEYLLGWDLGIDQLLFKESLEAAATAIPGRMPLATAFNLLMVGCALLLQDRNHRGSQMIAQCLSIVAGLIALPALIGYAYSIQSLYGIGSLASMALHTVLTFLVLVAAMLCARPDRGVMVILAGDTVGSVMVRHLLPAAIGAPFLLGWLRLMGQRAGLYDTEFGAVLFAISNMVVFTVLIWSNARFLNRVDIERKQAEEALGRSEERFATAFHASPVAISITALANERFIDVNDSFLRLTGFSRAEVIGRTPFGLGLWANREDQTRIEQVLTEQQPAHDLEIRFRTKSGKIIETLTSVELIDVAGQPCVLTLVHDITERRQAEEDRKQVIAELARSNRELEQFAYVASHDLQEPLRIVSSYVQLLARRYQGKLDQDADEFIAFTVEGANRMKTLINDLLAYSRVGTHGKDFAPVATDEVFDRAVSNLQLAIEDSSATVTHDPLPSVLADDVQMTQLLQNLIGNAIKFRSKEPPRVHVGARWQGERWLFFVRDNGIGIDPQYNERIFIIFQRLHNRDEYSGTGIGLAICRKIVERHGGRIWVESQPGKGATFYFTLRFAESVTPETEAAPPEAARPRAKDMVAERARDLV